MINIQCNTKYFEIEFITMSYCHMFSPENCINYTIIFYLENCAFIVNGKIFFRCIKMPQTKRSILLPPLFFRPDRITWFRWSDNQLSITPDKQSIIWRIDQTLRIVGLIYGQDDADLNYLTLVSWVDNKIIMYKCMFVCINILLFYKDTHEKGMLSIYVWYSL